MLLLELCALCLATGAAAGSVAYLASFVSNCVNESIAYQVNESVVSREVKESDVSPERGSWGARQPQWTARG